MQSTKTYLLCASAVVVASWLTSPRAALAQASSPGRPPAAGPAQKAPASPPSTGPTAVVRQRELMFNSGESVASAGLALGGVNGALGESEVPPIFAAFDFAVGPELSFGAIASYSKSSVTYGYGFASYKTSFSYKTVGLRGDYHVGKFLPVEKLDLYGGLLLGYGMVSVSADSSTPYGYGTGGSSASSNIVVWGVNIGARYFFSKALAAQVELGIGLGNVSLGLAYKL